MARPLRLEFAGACYHLTARGDRQEPIFEDDEDRLIFGRCRCAFFDENLMNKGPCAHLLALLQFAQPQRKDLASARVSSAEEAASTADAEVDSEEESDENA